jgi:hypothetical protein
MADVYNHLSRKVGAVDATGVVRNVFGGLAGLVDPDGTVRDPDGVVLGGADAAGGIYAAQGQRLGQVAPDGTVTDGQQQVIGSIEAGLDLDLLLQAGAARLLLLPLAPP